MDILKNYSDFFEWKDKNENFTIFDYLPIKMSPLQLFLASQLFFPEIVLKDGCIFIKHSRQYKFLSKYKNKFKDDVSLEKYINCVFIESMFLSDNKIAGELAKTVAKSWKFYFLNEHPCLNIKVEAYEDEYDGWCVTCWQVR